MAKHKEKLSQILTRRVPVLAKTVDTFAEAYPTIRTLRLAVVEDEGGLGRTYEESVFTEKTFTRSIDCHNTLCYGGGVDLGSVLHDMVRAGKTTLETTEFCRGHEGSKTKTGRRCTHAFRINATVSYGATSQKTES